MIYYVFIDKIYLCSSSFVFLSQKIKYCNFCFELSCKHSLIQIERNHSEPRVYPTEYKGNRKNGFSAPYPNSATFELASSPERKMHQTKSTRRPKKSKWSLFGISVPTIRFRKMVSSFWNASFVPSTSQPRK